MLGVRGVENDDRQQPGAASGRVRNDGKRDVDLLGQDRNADDEPHDGRAELHLRYVAEQNAPSPLRRVARGAVFSPEQGASIPICRWRN